MEIKKKLAMLVALVGIFIFSGVFMFQLQMAFGAWTGPGSSPPSSNGALSMTNGNLSVDTSLTTTDPATAALTILPKDIGQPAAQAAIDAMGGLIKGVATPVSGTDAVNKDYVLAQVADAGGGSITMYNVTKDFVGANGGQGVIGGQGVPACPTGYTEVVAGYGPHAFLSGYGWGGAGDLGFQDPDEIIPGTPGYSRSNALVAGSFSICSNSKYEIWPSRLPLNNISTGGIYPTYTRADACGQASVNEVTCNVCRVCVKGNPAIGAYGAVPADTR